MKSDLLWIGTVIDIYFPVSVVNKKNTGKFEVQFEKNVKVNITKTKMHFHT
jgi:hypothetical protein